MVILLKILEDLISRKFAKRVNVAFVQLGKKRSAESLARKKCVGKRTWSKGARKAPLGSA